MWKWTIIAMNTLSIFPFFMTLVATKFSQSNTAALFVFQTVSATFAKI